MNVQWHDEVKTATPIHALQTIRIKKPDYKATSKTAPLKGKGRRHSRVRIGSKTNDAPRRCVGNNGKSGPPSMGPPSTTPAPRLQTIRIKKPDYKATSKPAPLKG